MNSDVMPVRPVLLCDVMDTLVYNPFNREIPAFFGLTQAQLWQQKHPTAWIQFELGEIDEAEYFKIYFADGRSFDHQQFKRVVREAYRWMDGTEQLLRRLRDQGYEIHALSNYPIWYRTIENQLGLSRYLQWTFVSCNTGKRKPDAAAYLDAALGLNRPPRSCVFMDDNPANCQAAELLGMTAIQFHDAASAWSELRQRGFVG